jgi:RNA 2',3'-cyclic 3'-phosphodiesterase
MAATIRAFIAVKIPASPPLRGVLSQLGGMGRAVRAVSADNLHVTLKFLGDTSLEAVADIGRAVQRSVEAKQAFDLSIVGLGAFPHARRPSVIWAGFEGAEPLVEIAEELERELERLGVPRENRRFAPHLTLARIKSRPPAELGELLDRHPTTHFGTASITRVELFQSELTPDGPLYTVVASAEFP